MVIVPPARVNRRFRKCLSHGRHDPLCDPHLNQVIMDNRYPHTVPLLLLIVLIIARWYLLAGGMLKPRSNGVSEYCDMVARAMQERRERTRMRNFLNILGFGQLCIVLP